MNFWFQINAAIDLDFRLHQLHEVQDIVGRRATLIY
jgi:hypothetical protein